MKVNVKRVRLLVAVAIIAIIIIALIVKGNKDEEGKTAVDSNNSNGETTVIEGRKLAEVKKYEGLEVSNVKFEIDGTTTLLTADIRNSTSSNIDGQWININVLDKEGNRLTSIGGYIDAMEAGETIPLSSSILSNGKDTNAYDIEITPEREAVQTDTENQNAQNNGEDTNNNAGADQQ